MTSVVFPGQGSQFPGMARDFYDNFREFKDVFLEIEDSAKINLEKLIFSDNPELLNTTNFTQISIFAVSIGIYKTLERSFGFDFQNSNIRYMLGHSLGEYSAIAASKSLTISEVSILLKKRGELMNLAVEPNSTSMAALIGLNCDKIEDIIVKNNLEIEIANDNSPGQVVVSGLDQNIIDSERFFESEGVKKFVKLNVSAAFHSRFMIHAQEKLNLEIDKVKFIDPICSIISNYDASVNVSSKNITKNLKLQMSNRVRWTESILELEKNNENVIVEIGPGKVLSGLIKRISRNFEIISINNIEDLEKIKLL